VLNCKSERTLNQVFQPITPNRLILDALVYNTSDGYEIISLMSERKQLEKYLTPTSGVVTEFN